MLIEYCRLAELFLELMLQPQHPISFGCNIIYLQAVTLYILQPEDIYLSVSSSISFHSSLFIVNDDGGPF
ncbi:hypothetical protein DWX04_14855 [Phocaeicola vulgatus]|uniref:Uncharacterized protein n=1 Tax=Phocaeicola vulgatus TaxID=821 RepID=A0A415BS41_PHOVU|nr:hypothetical protein DWX04_14855 [Phocaeicola vulgatus]RHI91599.1 hypothetical protein DW150_09610 [Phocaeicola vulgatus]